jgi:CHASE3 domain sensor protein
MSVETLAVLLVLLIVGLAAAGAVFASILLVSRDTTRIPEVLSRLTKTEELITKLSTDVNVELKDNGNISEIWKSADGKYTANSFEELLAMMANDPEGPLTADEINAIKSVFEKITGDHDDDEDDKEPWKSE